MNAPPGEFDVAVIGGGPAGIAAAVAASQARRRVVLIDEGRAPGGQIWRRQHDGPQQPRALTWVARLERSSATYLGGTSVVSAERDDGGVELMLDGGAGPTLVRAGALILATGARELFLPFPGWTLPGVVGVGGIQALVKGGMRVHKKRIVVAGSGALLLPVAAHLARHGAVLPIVAEQASLARVARFSITLRPALVVQAAQYRLAFARTRYRTGTWVARANGSERVESVVMTDGVREWRLDCDMLAVAFGLVPNLELPRLLGCECTANGVWVDHEQGTNIKGIYAAGEVAGVAGVDVAIAEGTIAGLHAAAAVGFPRRSLRARERGRRSADRMAKAFALRAEVLRIATPDSIVCRCEDVTLGAIDPAWTSRQAKLYRRVGMGPCQGRVCGAAMSALRGWTPDSVRAPLAPIPLSSFAADSSHPPAASQSADR